MSHMTARDLPPPPEGVEQRTARAATSPAIISRRRLARAQRPALRGIAFLLLAVSFVGALIWGGGGADAWATVRWGNAGQLNVFGVIAALLGQGLVSSLQYIFSDWSATPYARWLWWLAFGASVAMSLAGYWDLAHPSLVAGLGRAEMPEPAAGLVAGGILVLLLGLLDYLPEKILAA